LERAGDGGGVAPANGSGATPPAVTLLAEFAITTGGWDLYFPLNFTVASNDSTVLYAWAVGGNFSSWPPPELPAGMNVAASVGYEGFAMGNLTAGNYSTNLSYPGWTNTASVAIYGVSGNSSTTFQFSSISELNQHPLLTEQVSLELPAGGAVYLAAQSTGGTWPINNSSISDVDVQAAALRGGEAGIIGRQASNLVSFDTIAAGGAIVGVAIDANASALAGLNVQLLASFSLTTGAWNSSFPVDFFVPPAVSQVLYLWTIGGASAIYVPPTLPAGLTVVTSSGFEGIAAGTLGPGSYSSAVYYAGYTAEVSVAVYGISDSENATYQFGSVSQPNPQPGLQQNLSLRLPGGAAQYLGIESNDGTWPVVNSSLSFVDEHAWAPQGGWTGEIGRQSSNNLSFATNASTGGIAGVGIFTNATLVDQPITFAQTGLPRGAMWTIVLDGSAGSTGANTVGFAGPGHTVSYVIAGPSGYAVSGILPSGTVQLTGGTALEQFQFVPARTVTLAFAERGLAAGTRWCVSIASWGQCTSHATVAFRGLTPGVYTYAVAPVLQHTVTARVGLASVPTAGSIDLLRTETIALHYLDPTPVRFTEIGLPSGTSWAVTLAGHKLTSSSDVIVGDPSTGAYYYRVWAVPGYAPVKSVGTVRVSGPVSIQITFVHRAGAAGPLSPANGLYALVPLAFGGVASGASPIGLRSKPGR
jgi:hypothetical protein